MIVKCSHCGSVLTPHANPELAQIGLDMRATNGERLLFRLLVKAHPHPVRRSALFNSLYGGRHDGGPDGANSVMKVQVSRLRKALEPLGWTIPRRDGGAGNEAVYGLERFDPVANPSHRKHVRKGVRHARAD